MTNDKLTVLLEKFWLKAVGCQVMQVSRGYRRRLTRLELENANGKMLKIRLPFCKATLTPCEDTVVHTVLRGSQEPNVQVLNANGETIVYLTEYHED